MTKTDLINDIIYEMSLELTKEQIDRLKITMLVKMQDYEITEMYYLPSITSNNNNDWLLQRFLVDGVAKGIKESTIKQYIRAVKKLLDSTGKHYMQLTGQDITDYLAIKQYRDHISPNYKATLCRYYFAFFQWAYKRHHIPEDIMRDVDRVKSVQCKKERLTDEEVEDIRDACNSLKEKAVLELMLSTGMRVGEIAALNVADVDLHRKRVNIYGIKTSTYRTGMLTTRAKKTLQDYIKSNNLSEGALFRSDKKPHNRLPKSSLENIAKSIAIRAGVNRISATVHIYRKTFASILYRKTKDILLVSKLLGHSSTAITVQYYLVDDIEDMQYRYNAIQ